jgi:signal transduction histidine kinase/ABC-type branched-subunit amino acid transport system ATPase component
MSSSSSDDILVVEGLSFDIQGKSVLTDLDIRIKRGEVHSLFGEEALARTVLLNVIAGKYRSYEGTVTFDGHVIRKPTPRLAMRMGIEIIDGSPKGFLNLSVAENIFAERLKLDRYRRIDRKVRRRRVQDFFDELAVDVDLDVPLASLSLSQRKLVEIARSVCSSPQLLLIDELVIDQLKSSIGPDVIEKLYYVFVLLVSGGATILSSSNDMDQLFKFADRVSVLKGGMIDATMRIKDIDKIQLVETAYTSILSRDDLERSNFELFYLKQIYEGIFDSIAFPIIVTDTRGKVLLVNRGVEKLFKAKKERLLSLPLAEALGVESGIVRAIEDETQKMSRTQFDRVPDIVPGIHTFACPVLDEVDSYTGMMLLFSRPDAAFDVAEGLRANSERFNSEQYIAKFIHEIKNPLGIIRNYLQLIRLNQSKDKISDNVLHIEHEVERISRLHEEPKEKPEALRQSGTQYIKASAIIDDIAELLIPKIANNEIKLNCDFTYDPILPFDPDLIRQVALNVMLNGIEAMPQGGDLEITCESETIDGKEYAVLEFCDTGGGIAKEDLDKVFEPFFTTKSDGHSRGIGLSICREIVTGLNGFFRVTSSLGEGAIFRLFLPILPTA